MKKVLIIGINSFTGKHLALYLNNQNYDVYGSVFSGAISDKIFQCDIRDKNSIKSVIERVLPDFIINLSGISFVDNLNKELFFMVNLFGVENILEAILSIKDYKPKKILLVSSATVYGNQSSDLLDEEMCPNPINYYGISKYSMEQIAKTYFDKLNIIIARPFNYTGIAQEKHFLIPKIVSHFKDKKNEIELGNIEVFREFNDIEYVCNIYEKLLNSDVKSEIVNVCSNRVIALKDVILMMCEIAKYSIIVKVNPNFVRVNEITKLSGSTDKLFKLIGKIEQKELKETLTNMFKEK